MPIPDVSSRRLSQLLSLDGRVAVITGAARGLGAAIASRLGEAGAVVVVADVDGAAAAAQAARLRDIEGLTAFGTAVDVRDEASLRRLADYAAETAGGLDIWVNNAGVYPSYRILEMSWHEWTSVLEINLTGTLMGAQQAARKMVEATGGGVILNIASISGFRAGSGGSAAYVASKHGVVGITKSLAVELGRHNIRVLGIAPSVTTTEGIRNVQDAVLKSSGKDFIEIATQRTSLGRPAVPDDIARVALFCVSDLATYMTGSVIPVDAGDLAQ